MTATRLRLLLIVLAVLSVVAIAPAHARDSARTDAEVKALIAKYVKLRGHTDFASFSERMAAIRVLGSSDVPAARKHLLDIARRAKSIDDRIVAIVTLGVGLDAQTAKELAGIVQRKDDPLLVQALSDAFAIAKDESALTWLAGDALRSKDPGVLLAAVDAQYLHSDPRAREALLGLFDEYRDKRGGVHIAHGVIRAIGSIGSRKDRTFLLRTPSYHEEGEWRLRLAGAEIMARQKPLDPNIVGALLQLLKDDHPVVREAAAESIGLAKVVELTAEVAELLDDLHIRTRAVAHEALVRMHDKELGWDAEDWQRYWKTRSVQAGAIKPEPSTSVSTYYGVKVRSDRLLFIVDLSGSMAFPWGAAIDKTRIGVAHQQLRKVLEGLDPDTLFNVIVFSDNVKAWRKGETLATKDAVANALKWVDKTFEKPEGGTFMHAALETAFEQNPQIDTIYLLTDGLATDGEPIVPEAILASVNRWNRYRRVVVNTFALTLEELDLKGLNKSNLAEIKRFMRRLARLTGGRCKIVTKPP